MNDKFIGKVKLNPVPAAIMFLALTAQVFHAYHLFLWSGHSEGMWGKVNAALYAGSIELAIAVFVLLGWTWVSWAFAVGSIGVNVAYYTNAHADTYGWGFMFDGTMVDRTWFFWLLAIFLPVGIAAFAHATEGHGSLGTDTNTGAGFNPVRWVKDKLDPDPDPGPKPDTLLGLPLTHEGLDLDTGSTVTKDAPGLVLGPVLTDMTLDDTDQAILSFLGSSGPSTKSEIARAVHLTVGALDRKKRGKRTGRLVKLEAAGFVVLDSGEGVWDVVRDNEVDLTLSIDHEQPGLVAGHRNGFNG